MIRPAEPRDGTKWLAMRTALWPGSDSRHDESIDKYFAGRAKEPLAVLFAVNETDVPIGFVELSIRPYAEGCTTEGVAYVEGWYVDPQHRGAGIGTALIRAAEAWGRWRGCSELASDAEIDNLASADAHRSLGFEEVGVIRCFRKAL